MLPSAVFAVVGLVPCYRFSWARNWVTTYYGSWQLYAAGLNRARHCGVRARAAHAARHCDRPRQAKHAAPQRRGRQAARQPRHGGLHEYYHRAARISFRIAQPRHRARQLEPALSQPATCSRQFECCRSSGLPQSSKLHHPDRVARAHANPIRPRARTCSWIRRGWRTDSRRDMRRTDRSRQLSEARPNTGPNLVWARICTGYRSMRRMSSSVERRRERHNGH